MSRSYILRKGVSKLRDLADGIQSSLPPNHGEVFYVNGITWANGFGTGSDANDGLSPEEPLMTLTKALSYCTTEANDYIFILDYYQPTGETWPVSVNKSLVNIIGLQPRHPSTKWVCMYAPSTTACMDIVADCVYLEGLGFYPNAASAGITVDDGKKMLHIHECFFAQGTYGLSVTSGDWGFNIAVTDSFFLSSLSSGGISVQDDPPGVWIEGCHFDRLTGDCINISAGAYHRIINNTFALKANTEGLAITLGSAVSRAFVSGNSAGYGVATTTSPYDDAGTVTTNNWGVNYLGTTAIDPV